MTPDEIARRRLIGQQLVRSALRSAAEIVRYLGAIQAQDYPGAQWAIGLRTRGIRNGDVDRALADGSIIRTHVLRPTWHFVAAEDLRWMLALTAPRVKQILAHYDRQLGIDGAVLQRAHAVIAAALRGHRQLTRGELALAMREAGINTEAQRLSRLVMHAELDALICSGERRGKQFTYALVDERVPPTPARSRDETLQALALRYFNTRGPATARDFSWWSGLTMADARRGIELTGGELTQIVSNGTMYWIGTAAAPRKRLPSPFALLLPNYDEYFIGLRDRSAIGHRLGSADLVSGGDAHITNVVLIDGQIVGGWTRTITEQRARIAFNLLVTLSAAETSAIATAGEEYGRFLGLPIDFEGLGRQRSRSLRGRGR